MLWVKGGFVLVSGKRVGSLGAKLGCEGKPFALFEFLFVIVVIVGGSIIVIVIISWLFGSAAMCGRPDFVSLLGIFFCRSAAFRSRLESGRVLNTRVLVTIFFILHLAPVLVGASATGASAATIVLAACTLACARARNGRARRRQRCTS